MGSEMCIRDRLEELLTPEDVVLALSASGNSPNVLKALRYAGRIGAVTIGCCGFDGGSLQKIVDICIHIPTPVGEYGPVEDIFNILGHLIYSYLKLSLKNQPQCPEKLPGWGDENT